MESQKFLIEKLKDLFNCYSYLEIKYEYKNVIDTHVVEIKPIHCFESDRPYKIKQIEIQQVFEEEFPYEQLIFITENILVKVNNPILELGVSNVLVFDDLDALHCQSMYRVNEGVMYESSSYLIETTTSKLDEVELVDVYYHPPIQQKTNSSIKKDSEIISESFFLINFAL